MKDRDEAWMRVEALAMRHPNYNLSNKGTTNNSYASPQHIDSSPPDEDGDTDQTPLTLEKIEAKANEVQSSFLAMSRYKESCLKITLRTYGRNLNKKTNASYNALHIYYVFFFKAKKMTNVNKVKPLLRRKSDLPQDSYTMRALSDHKRADEYLVTPPDPNNC